MIKSMNYDADCLVCGAGTAGCGTAKKLAEAGFSVILVDKKNRQTIGHPWEVTIERSIFARIGLKIPPERMEVEPSYIARYYADDSDHYIETEFDWTNEYTIKHSLFNSHLLAKTIKAGVVFVPNVQVTEPVILDDYVVGIKGFKNAVFGLKKMVSFTAPIVIDALGNTTSLRKNIPDDFYIKRQLRKQDFAYGWQQVHAVNSNQITQLEEKFGLSPGMSITRLGKHHAFENYHLRKNKTISMIFANSFADPGKMSNQNMKEFIQKNPYFGHMKYGGGGLIPVRRAIDNMVGNGYIAIGDAACQVIPTMGSGVASGLNAADIALRTITEALNDSDVSLKKLWGYNHKYHSKRGAILASYDIIRRTLQSLDSAAISEAFKAGFIKNEAFMNTFTSNTINYNLMDILSNIGTVINHLKLIPVGIHVVQAINDSKKIHGLYKEYPPTLNHKRFTAWQKHTSAVFNNYRTFAPGEHVEYY